MVPTPPRSRNRDRGPYAVRPHTIGTVKLAREVEKRLERLVDGLSAVVFRGRIHPVDVAHRLLREADLAAADGALGAEIPNHWTVRMSSSDLDGTLMEDLGTELTRALEETAAARGWRTFGPVIVHVASDPSLRAGSIALSSQSERGAAEPWGQLLDPGTGVHHDLTDNRMLVGRAGDADVRVDDAEISRRHAVLFREGGKAWVRDLGSANGTAVNGRRVGATPVAVLPGDTVSFGPATFTLRLRS